MKEAQFYSKGEDYVKCELCPRFCKIKEGQVGFCKVRKNENGKLNSLVYNKVVALQIDPIEKKPLFHFYPGEKVFSFGTRGCNLRCKHCQNWEISQEEDVEEDEVSAKEIVEMALSKECKIIAATYNEPTIFFEFMIDVFKLARIKGLKTVVVSNGFINPEPLEELIEVTDAFNIDLKAYDDGFYKKVTVSWLAPILETIKIIHKSKSWLEITNLLIPSKNSSEKQIRELIEWVVNNLGGDVPLHFSAFYPMYKMDDVGPTSKKILDLAFNIAKEKEINYVYQGNLRGEENTYCSNCKELLIERFRYKIKENTINKIVDGICSKCGVKVKGYF